MSVKALTWSALNSIPVCFSSNALININLTSLAFCPLDIAIILNDASLVKRKSVIGRPPVLSLVNRKKSLFSSSKADSILFFIHVLKANLIPSMSCICLASANFLLLYSFNSIINLFWTKIILYYIKTKLNNKSNNIDIIYEEKH